MYQQKYPPYQQMSEVYEQQQFQQEDQPLVQEVDPTYQPTQKQIKQYAIQTLGMQLPEDQRLLYLAKQGLKAPIPKNWQPYQGRDGQVYYKHKITQQKTYEHPTDIQYRKKYQQEKQKMARKNLKSMAIKNNPMSLGLSNQPLGYQALGAGSKVSGMNPLSLGSSQSQTLSKQISKLDPKLQQELEQEIQQLEIKLKKQLKQFQKQRQQQSQKRLKKYKEQFESGIKSLTNKKSNNEYYAQIKQEKQRIKTRIQQAYHDRLKDELSQVERQEQHKYSQFCSIYQEDNNIKIKKHQIQLQQRFKTQEAKIYQAELKYKQQKKGKELQRAKVLAQIKKKLQDANNTQIQSAVQETFVQQLQRIKGETKQKIIQKQAQLQHQYNQMRKVLGVDPNYQLQEIASRKAKLKQITQQKIQSLKKKQYQLLNTQSAAKLQNSIKQLKQKIEIKQLHDIQKVKQQEAAKLIKLKQKYSKQHQEKLQKRISQLYQDAQKSTTQYQNSMNKKLSDIRNTFIKDIENKNNKISSQIQTKIKIKDKQKQIQNKQMLIEGIKRQLQLQKMLHDQLKMQKELAQASDIDSYLKNTMTRLGIKYKSQLFFQHQKRFNQLKQKYKRDKQILASLMQRIQSNSMFSFYGKNSQSQSQNYSTSTTSAIVKQYNQDVRKMRKNQQMILKYESTLKRAQLNNQQALQQLKKQNAFIYEEIEIKQSLNLNDKQENKLQQIQNFAKGQKKILNYQTHYDGGYQNIQDSLKQHSNFLVTVKNQLNRKLYKVRQNFSYRF